MSWRMANGGYMGAFAPGFAEGGPLGVPYLPPLMPRVPNPLEDLRTSGGADEDLYDDGSGAQNSSPAAGYSEIGDPNTVGGKIGLAAGALIGSVMGLPATAVTTVAGILGALNGTPQPGFAAQLAATLGITPDKANAALSAMTDDMMGTMSLQQDAIDRANAVAQMNDDAIGVIGAPVDSPLSGFSHTSESGTPSVGPAPGSGTQPGEAQSFSENQGTFGGYGSTPSSPDPAPSSPDPDPGGEPQANGGRIPYMGAFADGGQLPRGAMVDALARKLLEQMKGQAESWELDWRRPFHDHQRTDDQNVLRTLGRGGVQNEVRMPDALIPRGEWSDRPEDRWKQPTYRSLHGEGPDFSEEWVNMADGGRLGAFAPGGEVPPGSYILPADVMAAKGNGDNRTGARRMGAFIVEGPGDGRSDQVAAHSAGRPLRLSNGEGVMPPERVRRMGGPDALDRDVLQTRRGFRKRMGAFGAPRGAGR